MTLAISIGDNIFPCAFQNARLSSQVLQCARLYGIIKVITHLIKVLMLMNSSILTTKGRDALKPTCIWFKPFANSIRDTKHQGQCKSIINEETLLKTKNPLIG